MDLESAEHLQAIHFRHVDVEQYHDRPRLTALPATDPRQHLLPVAGDLEGIGQFVALERPQREIHVHRVVIGQQDRSQRVHFGISR